MVLLGIDRCGHGGSTDQAACHASRIAMWDQGRHNNLYMIIYTFHYLSEVYEVHLF